MKKIFLLFFTLFSFSFAYAQGNLQFSQAIFNEYSTSIGPTTGYQSAGTLTVGANKAIKITDVHELGDVMISQLSGLFENKKKLH